MSTDEQQYDEALRRGYAARFGIRNGHDTPPGWEALLDHAKEEGRFEGIEGASKAGNAFRETIAALFGEEPSRYSDDGWMHRLVVEYQIGRAAIHAAHVEHSRAADLRRALISVLSAKPRRFSMFQDGELLALAHRRARSPLWRLVTRVLA